MIESQKAKIRKGMGPRRDPTCYRVERDIVIPAGTILRSMGDNRYAAAFGHYGEFSITAPPGFATPDTLKKVAAS
jgi:hypothetical protein